MNLLFSIAVISAFRWDTFSTALETIFQPEPEKGKIHLRNHQNQYYVGEIAVGTPAQKFSVLFDTGSTLIWIPNSTCTSGICKYARNKFFPNKSSTANVTDTKLSNTFGSGLLNGSKAYDRVCAGSYCSNQQVFGLITYSSVGHHADDQFDGIFGMGTTSPKVVQRLHDGIPFDVNVLSQFPEKLFTFWFPWNPKTLKGYDGELTLGNTNKKHYRGKITYGKQFTPTPASWQLAVTEIGFKVSRFRIWRKKYRIPYCQSNCTGSVDTGAELTQFPYAEKEVFSYLLKKGLARKDGRRMVCNCSKIKKLPKLFVKFKTERKNKDYELLVEPGYYTYVDHDQPNICVIGLKERNPITMKNTSIHVKLGLTFLRKYYTVFNLEKNTVGFAKAKK